MAAIRAAFSSAINRAVVRESIDTEEAGWRLMAVTQPDLLEWVTNEVTRREAVFARLHRESLRTPQGSPLRMAFESVTDDVIKGRFG